jgi:hypothetical protein
MRIRIHTMLAFLANCILREGTFMNQERYTAPNILHAHLTHILTSQCPSIYTM